jgi:hypothetical protein
MYFYSKAFPFTIHINSFPNDPRNYVRNAIEVTGERRGGNFSVKPTSNCKAFIFLK